MLNIKNYSKNRLRLSHNNVYSKYKKVQKSTKTNKNQQVPAARQTIDTA